MVERECVVVVSALESTRLDSARQDVAVVRQARREGRAVVEDVPGSEAGKSPVSEPRRRHRGARWAKHRQRTLAAPPSA